MAKIDAEHSTANLTETLTLNFVTFHMTWVVESRSIWNQDEDSGFFKKESILQFEPLKDLSRPLHQVLIDIKTLHYLKKTLFFPPCKSVWMYKLYTDAAMGGGAVLRCRRANYLWSKQIMC